jgi:hypothetical protein
MNNHRGEPMIRKLALTAITVSLLVCAAHGQWVSLKNGASQPEAPRVTVLHDDRNSTVVNIEISGFTVNDNPAGSVPYKSVDLHTDAFTTEAGYPELPCVTEILAVPDLGEVSVEVVDIGEEQTFAGFVVPPARPSWHEGEPEPPFVKDEDAYHSSNIYPSRSASLDDPAVFRDFRIVRLAVYPVRYIAAKNELRVASSLTVRLSYGAGIGTNPKTSPRKPIAPSFAPLYRATIANYEGALMREYNGLQTGRDVMLCIVPDAFYNSILPFATWRNKTGTQVVVTKFSEIGANASNPDIIKNYIAQVYHAWQYPPTYILLGGDYGYVPIKQITYDYTIVSEDYYVEIDGNDFIPEIMIGRFTHESDVTEQNIVSKIVNYERTPYLANTAWYKKGVVAANNAYESAIVTKRFTRDRMMLDGGFTQVDTFMSHSPCYSSLSDLLNVLSNGRSFLNYRGEGWYTGWTSSCYYFQTSNVSSINNGRMLTFVTSIGCGVAAFNQSSCFGEAWLELGTVASPRGAVTFVGPTSNTHTAYNNKIDVGIYKGLFQEGLETPGQALMRGRMLMYGVFGNERWTEYQTRVYCILGDPSLHVWRTVPQPVTVTHVPTMPIGYNQIVVTVVDSLTGAPLPKAQVCLTGRQVYATAYSDAGGRATLQATPEILDTLSVLVRGGNVIPYENSIRVTQEVEHVAPLGSPIVVDLDGNLDGWINPNEHGQLTFTLKNWGTQTASDVQATMNVDTSMIQMETVSPVSFGNLAPGDSVTGAPFRFLVKPTCAVGDVLQFGLHVASSSQSWDYLHTVEVAGPKLKCANYLIDDRAYTRPNARLDPGETVRVYLSLKNSGQDAAPNVHAVLRCTSPYVSILDSLATLGTIAVDSTVMCYADYFMIKAENSSPTNYRVPFSVFLYTENGVYPYAVVDTFSIGVSMARPGDPTGPDTYGYYAYGSDDTLYQLAPRYNWFEISTVGTRVTGSGGNFTSTVTLPFTFKYYGVNYTQVRISSDGWIAFGSGTQTAPSSYCLPHSDNVSSMVAAFWDDLFYTTSPDSQKVLYYYHEATQRFIVEWYYVGHNNSHIGQWNKETFQIILANTPTPTGDGEILMQFKAMAYPVECTVGLEDHTQTVALQYVCYDQPSDESASLMVDGFALLFTTRTPQLLVDVKEPSGGNGPLPTEFALLQNYPNPFNPGTRIPFVLQVSGFTSLKVYDVLGREVATLVNEVMQPGSYEVTWEPEGLASGVYFYRLTVSNFTGTRKLLLLR